MATIIQEDDGEEDIEPTKILLIDVLDDEKSFSTILDGSSKQQVEQHFLGSIDSTLLIRQLPSQGLSFQLWPAATTLVALLDHHHRVPSNSPLTSTLAALSSSNAPDSCPLSILELGSGTGLVGIAAAATLAANVTVTDLPHVISNLQFNADANAEAVARLGGKVRVAPLRWGEPDDVELLGRGFDLILASDVVYHDHLYDPLLKTLRLMLLEDDKHKTMVFVMAHLRRWKKDSVFFKKARKLFHVEVIHVDPPCEGSRIGVVVYSFKRKCLYQNVGLKKQ